MASSLQDYLKRYTSGSDKTKKKKNKAKASKPSVYGSAITIVDDDPFWQKEIKDESADEDDQDDAPLVIKDLEVIRMQKMEALKMHRPYISTADDGSGWVHISDVPRQELGSAASVIKTGLSSQQQICSPQKNLQGSPDLSLERKVRQDSMGPSSSGRSQHRSSDLFPPMKGKQDTPESSPLRLHSGRKHHDSPDLSPKRKGGQETHDLSPPRLLSGRGNHDSLDLSPTRIGRQEASDLCAPKFHSRNTPNESPDLSPPRKGRHEAPNLSPPRKGRHEAPNLSPPRLPSGRNRHDSPDFSHPRKGRNEVTNLSSPRLPSGRNCHDSTDLSPPRKGKQENSDRSSLRLPSGRRCHDSQDSSPPRKGRPESLNLSPRRKDRLEGLDSSPPRLPSGRSRHDSPDLSPLRKSKQERLDLSPRRKTRQETFDFSPPRLPSGRNHHDSPDSSPPKKCRREGLSLSPQRKVREETPDLLPPRQKRQHAASDLSPVRNASRKREKMVDCTATGLQSRRQLVEEIKHRKQEESRRFSEMDAAFSGRAADTVYRDRHGRRLESLDELLKLQQPEKLKVQPLEWGKGLAQKREAEARQAELEAEKFKPFARSRDDPDLDKELKERVRWGDPMAYLVKKKQTSEPVLEDLGESKEMRDSGFIVPQDIPKHSWLKRGITPPPNRYGIKPGRHWDGVDRSNGFEKDMYRRQNEKKANELEAYLWSVSEM